MDRLSDIARGNFSRNNISAEYWLRKVVTWGIQRDEIVRLLLGFTLFFKKALRWREKVHTVAAAAQEIEK